MIKYVTSYIQVTSINGSSCFIFASVTRNSIKETCLRLYRFPVGNISCFHLPLGLFTCHTDKICTRCIAFTSPHFYSINEMSNGCCSKAMNVTSAWCNPFACFYEFRIMVLSLDLRPKSKYCTNICRLDFDIFLHATMLNIFPYCECLSCIIFMNKW